MICPICKLELGVENAAPATTLEKSRRNSRRVWALNPPANLTDASLKRGQGPSTRHAS
jgi:hypothetical protein